METIAEYFRRSARRERELASSAIDPHLRASHTAKAAELDARARKAN